MDKGPWVVINANAVSNDFTHDVVLRITGDFADYDEKLKYANWLVNRLNSYDQLTVEHDFRLKGFPYPEPEQTDFEKTFYHMFYEIMLNQHNK
jgi:hypothetical protein